LDILSHSLYAAVKRDLPEPAVPMMNTIGMFSRSGQERFPCADNLLVSAAVF
jgi:hypothetical protein